MESCPVMVLKSLSLVGWPNFTSLLNELGHFCFPSFVPRPSPHVQFSSLTYVQTVSCQKLDDGIYYMYSLVQS